MTRHETRTEYCLTVDHSYNGESDHYYPTLAQAMDANLRAQEGGYVKRTWIHRWTWERRGTAWELVDVAKV